MTEVQSHPDQTERVFPHQLLAALVSPVEIAAAARRVCDAWIRFGGAVSATVVLADSPTQLTCVSAHADSAGEPISATSLIGESLGVLLAPARLREVVTPDIAKESAFVTVWREIPAALIVDNGPPQPLTRQKHAIAHQTLFPLSRRLLAESIRSNGVNPNADHLEAMAEFSAGAGHEINNPLGSILGQTQLLLRGETSAAVRQALEIIGSQAWRIRDMIGDVMLFARPPSPEFQSVELVELCRRVVDGVVRNRATSDVEVQLECSEPTIAVEADAAQLQTLIGRLVQNSIEAILNSGNSGKAVVRLSSDVSNAAVGICVCDNGPGVMDEIIRRHLFDPFFSGRSAGRGLGFGLSLAWQIVRSHAGILIFQPGEGGGAEFHVALPVRQLMESL